MDTLVVAQRTQVKVGSSRANGHGSRTRSVVAMVAERRCRELWPVSRANDD